MKLGLIKCWFILYETSVFSFCITHSVRWQEAFSWQSIRKHKSPVWVHLSPEVWRDLSSHGRRVGKDRRVGVRVVTLATHTSSGVSFLTVLCHNDWAVCALSSLSGWLLWQDALVQWINCKINVSLLQREVSCLLLWFPTPKPFLPLLCWRAATALWKSSALIVQPARNWKHTGLTHVQLLGITLFALFQSLLHLTKERLIFKHMPYC